MPKLHRNAKVKELQDKMRALGRKLDAGDESSLFIEVIPDELVCSHRPLRRNHDPRFRGGQRHLPAEGAPVLLNWIQRMRTCRIRGIISLMGPSELAHYSTVVSQLGAADLIDLYRSYRFEVRSIPWEDPFYPASQGGLPYDDRLREVCKEALLAFNELSKPVLLHCSSGIQRSSPVAAFIYSERYRE